LKIERKLVLTAYVVHGLSIAAKMYDLNDLCAILRVIDSLNAAKSDEIQLSNDTDAM